MSYGDRVWQAPSTAAGNQNERSGPDQAEPANETLDIDAVMAALEQMDEDKRAIALRRLDTTARLARGVLGAAPDDRPEIYESALRKAKSAGVPVGNLPKTYDASIDPLLERQIGLAQAILDRAASRSEDG